MATNALSHACCSVPPVVTSGYIQKGTYTEVGGLKTYTVGSISGERGVVFVYDVFALADQTLQGADRLAAMLNAVVIVPDFYKGNGIDMKLWPINTPEKQATVGRFLAGPASFPDNVDTLLKSVVPDAKSRYSSVRHWGVFGLCWGGKVAALACGEGTPFSVSGQAHPSRLTAVDAGRMIIPHVCLASKGEDPAAVNEYKEILGENGEVQTYTDQKHGWMGGRCDFNDEKNAKEFERGYKQVADFFAKHL